MIMGEQVETERYTGHCLISNVPNGGTWMKQCDVEINRSGKGCWILIRDTDGHPLGVIGGVERSNLREEPEGGLHWDRSIPDDKTR